MSDIQDAFKSSAEKLDEDSFAKRNPVSLTYYSGNSRDGYGTAYRFDFLLRVVTVVDTKDTIHFREFDRDTLEFMRDKLIELGGTPPPLPAKETANMMAFKPRRGEVSP